MSFASDEQRRAFFGNVEAGENMEGVNEKEVAADMEKEKGTGEKESLGDPQLDTLMKDWQERLAQKEAGGAKIAASSYMSNGLLESLQRVIPKDNQKEAAAKLVTYLKSQPKDATTDSSLNMLKMFWGAA